MVRKARGEQRMGRIEYVVEIVIFNSRWILAPFYLGLIVGLLLLLGHFVRQLVEFILHIHTASEPDVILGVLEQELPAHAVVPLLRIRHGDVEVVERVLDDQAPVVGRALRDLPLPDDCRIAVIIRAGAQIFPGGDTRLAAGDEVIALTTTRSESRLRDLLWASR